MIVRAVIVNKATDLVIVLKIVEVIKAVAVAALYVIAEGVAAALAETEETLIQYP